MKEPEVGFDTRWLFPRKTAAFLNLWYRSYEEARQALEEHPDRFLFPYGSHFVVCEGSMLEHLGLDTNDPDWQRIGHDWSLPPNWEAWRRLSALLQSKLKEPEARPARRLRGAETAS